MTVVVCEDGLEWYRGEEKYSADYDDLIDAYEKQIAKKVVMKYHPKTPWTREITQYLCPICSRVIGFNGTTFCSTCGQKLDWSNENE